MRRSLRLLLLVAALLGDAPGQEVAAGVEPHVRQAFARAWQRLPAPWREQLADVSLHRKRSLGVPAAAPMSALLLDRAALAFFSNVQRRIVVTDAGARLRPTWGRPAPSREQVAGFLLDEVGYAGGGSREQAVDAAWAQFVRSVYGWRGEQAPDPLPPVGTVEVIDRFLADGVRRSLGGDVPLEQLLFHELAHAVQNDLRRMTAHMATWGSLSGWRECADGRAADGFSGGMFAIEQPVVLIRLLLDLPRGTATYAPHPRAQFVNRYARFDLREDFAECARLMAYDPDGLLAAAPAKFLYLNALGFSGRLDLRRSGPLWQGIERLRKPHLRQFVVAGARALLANDPALPVPDPLAVAAILRAHAPLLGAADLPPAHAPLVAPSDLPTDLRARLSTERFTFTVDGVERQPPPAGIRRRWDDEVVTWIEHREFVEGLEGLLVPSSEEIQERYRDEVQGAGDADARARAFDRLLVAMPESLPAAVRRKLCRAEAEHHARLGRGLTARRYELLAGQPSAEQLAAAANALRSHAAADFAAVELATVIAQAHADAGDRRAALASARAIPGASWGAFRRVEQLLRNGAVDEAERVAKAVGFPRLREKLLLRVRSHGR